MIPKMTVPYIFCVDFQIPIDRTSHFLLGHSDSNLKEEQFSIEMISKMTEPYFYCRDIQIPNEKCSSVSR